MLQIITVGGHPTPLRRYLARRKGTQYVNPDAADETSAFPAAGITPATGGCAMLYAVMFGANVIIVCLIDDLSCAALHVVPPLKDLRALLKPTPQPQRVHPRKFKARARCSRVHISAFRHVSPRAVLRRGPSCNYCPEPHSGRFRSRSVATGSVAFPRDI